MKLTDMLYKVYENTTVWIAEDPTDPVGIYFGAAGDIQLRTAVKYDVVKIYPERYPAIGNICGITIVVKERE